MSQKIALWLFCLSLLGAVLAAGMPSHAADEVKQVRLYTLDCGRIDIKDLSAFSDTGDYEGKSGSVAVPCVVIRHPNGTLVWDTGLSDKLVENKNGVENGGFRLRVRVTLADQLKTMGLAP